MGKARKRKNTVFVKEAEAERQEAETASQSSTGRATTQKRHRRTDPSARSSPSAGSSSSSSSLKSKRSASDLRQLVELEREHVSSHGSWFRLQLRGHLLHTRFPVDSRVEAAFETAPPSTSGGVSAGVSTSEAASSSTLNQAALTSESAEEEEAVRVVRASQEYRQLVLESVAVRQALEAIRRAVLAVRDCDVVSPSVDVASQVRSTASGKQQRKKSGSEGAPDVVRLLRVHDQARSGETPPGAQPGKARKKRPPAERSSASPSVRPLQFGFSAPADLQLVGSFISRTVCMPRVQQQGKAAHRHGNVDIAFEIPSRVFQRRDALNWRYFDKRNLYVQTLARLLQEDQQFAAQFTVELAPFRGQLCKPIIVLRSKLTPLTSFRLLPCVDCASTFNPRRFQASRCNVRPDDADEKYVRGN
jgi:Nrap protein domain 1